MRLLFALVAVLLSATLFAAPPVKTARTVDSIKHNLNHFRLWITLFDHDKSQEDRSVDVEVTDDDDANAEGLMNHAQALRVLDALAGDGFLERAKEMGKNPWEPPPQPFYLVRAEFDDTSGLYEFRAGDAALTGLLVAVRDALAKGLAALSADRAVAVLDPHSRRWQPAGGSNTFASPPLSPGVSPLHPDYSFVPIDKAWRVREEYLKPVAGDFGSSAVADETTLNDYKSWFRELTFSKLPEDRDCKVVIQFPSGRVYSEVDSYEYGVDFPRGDLYQRLFREGGKIIFYSHVKDGKTMEATAFDGSGNVTGHVAGGKGFVRRPTFDPDASDATWYYEGLLLFERHLQKDGWTSETLNDNTESGHAATLTIKPDGSETMFQDELEWTRQTDGTIGRQMLYSSDTHQATSAQLKQEYAGARKKFASRFTARVTASGFRLKDMDLSDPEFTTTQTGIK